MWSIVTDPIKIIEGNLRAKNILHIIYTKYLVFRNCRNTLREVWNKFNKYVTRFAKHLCVERNYFKNVV